MVINFRYKNFTPEEKERFEKYFNEKLPRLEEWLGGFESNEAKLRVAAEKFSKKAAYNLILELNLPKDHLRSSEDDHTITEVIDLALDKLIIQLRKLNDRAPHRVKNKNEKRK
ncbi:MAG: HPF/RaiA family ribosome-associated protein [Patescibacteria group bacterium]|nr:HPF/RaiA family ribosome-associated protein [Patescibacteria group bacterium]MDD5490610.1 HPF/RaiA family ribosome-associated protein [Patescibacteria group bacterium]